MVSRSGRVFRVGGRHFAAVPVGGLIMDRKKLLEQLQTVAPALASSDFVPVMTHFWFTGKHVIAYDDIVGISVPLSTDFKGAVPGSIILNLLKNSRGGSVEFTPDAEGSEVAIRVGEKRPSKFRLALLPPEEFLFKFPKKLGKVSVVKKEFLKAIEWCLASVGDDTSTPDQLGVTLLFSENRVEFYSTNDATLSHAVWKGKCRASIARVILPTSFCRLLSNCVSKNVSISFSEDGVLADLGRSGVRIFGRLIHSEKPIDFKEILEEHYTKKTARRLVGIPDRMRGIVERAMVVTESYADPGFTKINIEQGRGSFVSTTGRGVVRDVVKFGTKHPDSEIVVDPKLLRPMLKICDKMLITDSCIVFKRGLKFIHLISARA